MNELLEHSIHCPYCDESIVALIDGSLSEQSYVEDCQVCCRPILLNIAIGPDGGAEVNASTENE